MQRVDDGDHRASPLTWDVLAGRASPAAIDALRAYWRLLREANAEFNLTRITDEDEFILKHALDALLGLEHLGETPGPWVDIGSGGGVPGLVLAIAAPEREVVLVESIGKKAAFLERAAKALGLSERVSVRAERAEVTGRGALRESSAAVVARAVSSVATCLELTLPLARVGGRVVLYRGPADAAAELSLAEGLAPRLGGGRPRSELAHLPSGAERRFLIVPKAEQTPDTFPRRDGVPAKRPLS